MEIVKLHPKRSVRVLHEIGDLVEKNETSEIIGFIAVTRSKEDKHLGYWRWGAEYIDVYSLVGILEAAKMDFIEEALREVDS